MFSINRTCFLRLGNHTTLYRVPAFLLSERGFGVQMKDLILLSCQMKQCFHFTNRAADKMMLGSLLQFQSRPFACVLGVGYRFIHFSITASDSNTRLIFDL